jgi:hypothetical protein
VPSWHIFTGRAVVSCIRQLQQVPRMRSWSGSAGQPRIPQVGTVGSVHCHTSCCGGTTYSRPRAILGRAALLAGSSRRGQTSLRTARRDRMGCPGTQNIDSTKNATFPTETSSRVPRAYRLADKACEYCDVSAMELIDETRRIETTSLMQARFSANQHAVSR